MKKALIIHGWGGNPNEPLFKYLQKELGLFGYESVVPQMPKTEHPIIKDWVDKTLETFDGSFDLIIGHSIGCQTILRFIENLDPKYKIPKIILISPWFELNMKSIEEEGGQEGIEIARPWIETPINLENIKNKTEKIYAVFSNNDDFVPISQADVFREKLGATIFIEKEQGHFTEGDGFQRLQTETSKLLS